MIEEWPVLVLPRGKKVFFLFAEVVGFYSNPRPPGQQATVCVMSADL